MKCQAIHLRFMFLTVGLVGLLTMIACSSGGDGGGGGTPSVAAPMQGVFVDSPVQGLGYLTQPSGLSGVTNASGQFNYNPGDTVTFNLFGRVIGAAVPATPVVTALSVFGATSITDPRVLNLSQLLLTLGGTLAGSNPIVVPATPPAGFPATLDFSAADFDTSFPGLISEAVAASHLQANFSTLSVSVAGSGASGGSVTSNPAGLTCGAVCSADFFKGTAVTLTASGAGFTGWSGGCTGTGVCVVTLTANTAVTATFTAVPVNANLTVTKAGNGTGTVTSSPAGINCGATCSASLVQGTVDLAATAASGSTFAGWSNGTGNASCTGTSPCSIPLTVDSTVTATFTLNAVPVLVTANIASGNGGAGTVQCSANGGAAGPCGSYLPGAAIVMTATPNSISNFTGWNGAGCSGTGTCNFTLAANTTVTANFNRPTLTVQVNGTGSVSSNPTGINACTTNCTASFDKGSPVTLTAGTGLTGWSGGGCAGTGNCVVTLDQGATVTASFGTVSGSARYHFFMSTNSVFLGTNGPLMAVDPAAPTAMPVTIATDVASSLPVYSSTWDTVTTSFPSFYPVFQIYDSNGSLWRVNVATSSGVPGSAGNPPVRISSESAATHVCAFVAVDDVTSPNTRRLFYELPGADGQCGYSGQGTIADNVTKFVSLADGPSIAPTVLGIGLSLPRGRTFVYDFSTGVATHMFVIDAANSNTLKIVNLSTQAITPIQANIGDISISVQDTSNRVFLSSLATNTLYIYTVSSNSLVPLTVAGGGGLQSDGVNFFVADGTAGVVYRGPLTATAAGQVTPILNLGGQIYNYVATTNRVYVTAPDPNGTRIVSVPKSGGAFRVDVPAVAGDLIAPLLQTSNGLFYYTKYTPSANFQTVVSATTVALYENGTPAASFANTGQTGFIVSTPFNLRAVAGTLSKVLVSTYVGGVFQGGTMTAIDPATATASATVGTVPSTVPSLGTNLFFVDTVDDAALGIGFLPASANFGVFFMDSAIPNSLVQVPVAPGSWTVVH